MAYKITEDCISCGACEAECSSEAISEGEETYVIDPDKCTECVGNFESPKCAEVCSVDACKPDPEHAESREELLAKQVTPGRYAQSVIELLRRNQWGDRYLDYGWI